MISLRDFVNKRKYNYPSYFGYTFDDFMESNGVTEETVTADMIDWYVENVCDKRTFSHPAIFSNEGCQFDEYVNEMLQTTSIGLLIKTLNKELGANNELSVKKYTDDDFEIKNHKDAQSLAIPQELYNKEKIAEICSKMMWVWTSVKIAYDTVKNPFRKGTKPAFMEIDKSGKRFAIIKVEPELAEKRTDYVQNYCDGIIYHICKKSDVESILKTGLRLKGDKNSYRYIKNKVYFCCASDNSDLIEAIKYVAESKGYWDYHKQSLRDDAALLKIDVSDYNIDFYCDKMYASDFQDFVVYAYNYIPPKLISEITFEEAVGEE